MNQAQPRKTDSLLVKKARKNAQTVYILIIGAFLTVICVAVISTMAAEKEKQNLPIFHPIKVTQPISFIDQTYVDKNAAKQK